jgi:uncharacterized Zn-finger protein
MKNTLNHVIKGATLNSDGTFYVTNRKVSCEGSLEHSKHPLVYLKIPHKETGEEKIICPYCKQTFIYKENEAK